MPKQSIGNLICLKGVSLKVSETLRTKKKEVMCQMHTSASVQTQSPVSKAVKHNLQEERDYLFFNLLSTENLEMALGEASCGQSMLYSSLPYPNLMISFLFPVSLFCIAVAHKFLWLQLFPRHRFPKFPRGTTLCMRVWSYLYSRHTLQAVRTL